MKATSFSFASIKINNNDNLYSKFEFIRDVFCRRALLGSIAVSHSAVVCRLDGMSHTSFDRSLDPNSIKCMSVRLLVRPL